MNSSETTSMHQPSTSIYPRADVRSADVGRGTEIAPFTLVFPGAVIGADCRIGAQCTVEDRVQIADGCRVDAGVQLPAGTQLGRGVCVGANVAFAGWTDAKELAAVTSIEDGAEIGAGAVLAIGITIGRNAEVRPGAVVSRSVPANAVVEGNPAKIVGYAEAGAVDAAGVAVQGAVGRHATRVAGVTVHRLPRVIDMRGNLTAGEFGKSVPFDVKRYFMVFDVPSLETRGEHAHRECHQFLICVRGSCALVADDGKDRQEFVLNAPDLGVHLPPMTWGIQYKYTSDAVLLVFASHYYDSGDYIRDYSTFLRDVERKHSVD
jgi:UDP-2-acetamido-3-amino-2,3-dideoxy-glucuronate N-acetyltransferase